MLDINRRSLTSVLTLAAAALIAVAAVAYAMLPRGESDMAVAVGMIDSWLPETGKVAPDFALVDARDGTTVRKLSDYRGKTVVLNWYASWCGPCRTEMPDFEAAYQELDGELVVLALNLMESRSTAVNMLESVGATFPSVLDSDGAVASHYGVRGMPTTFFLDADGVIRASGTGRITDETLRLELTKLGHDIGVAR